MAINDTPEKRRDLEERQKLLTADAEKLEALMNTPYLKSCPLCGAEVKLYDHGRGTGGWMVSCYCGVMKVRTATCSKLPPHAQCRTDVIDQWNNRAAAEAAEEKP